LKNGARTPFNQGVDRGREEAISLITSLEEMIATEEGKRAEATQILERLKSGTITFDDADGRCFLLKILKEKEAANH
jgi:hypothetical protein